MERFLTVAEVAELLHVTPETVRRMVRRGQLHASKVGRSLFVAEAELAKLLKTGTAPVGRPKARAQESATNR